MRAKGCRLCAGVRADDVDKWKLRKGLRLCGGGNTDGKMGTGGSGVRADSVDKEGKHDGSRRNERTKDNAKQGGLRTQTCGRSLGRDDRARYIGGESDSTPEGGKPALHQRRGKAEADITRLVVMRAQWAYYMEWAHRYATSFWWDARPLAAILTRYFFDGSTALCGLPSNSAILLGTV